MRLRNRSWPAVSLRVAGGRAGAPWQPGPARELPALTAAGEAPQEGAPASPGPAACCPATHHSCNLTVLSSRYIVFDRKSMPMVACTRTPVGWGVVELGGPWRAHHGCCGLHGAARRHASSAWHCCAPRGATRCALLRRRLLAGRGGAVPGSLPPAHLVGVVEFIIHEPRYDASLAY
jgi:hypothetical protein